jgi:arylsulfatase A-like enzyme
VGQRDTIGRRLAARCGGARRRIVGLLLAGCAALSLPACEQAPTGPAIVVVTIDTLRADHLGSYGYFRDTSGAFDRFARESLLFENAYSTAAATLPAHVALWTSRHPNQTGVLRNRDNFAPRADGAPRLLAQWLRAAGWRTAAFVSASSLAADTGIHTGFEVFDAPRRSTRSGAITTDLALEWLDDVEGPYFLWVHYFEPHGPYEPPEAFRRFTADAGLRDFLAARAFADPDDAAVLDVHDRYDGEVAFADAQLERLLGFLRASGRWDEAAIVVTADHGEGLMEHGVAGHVHLGREQLHVPLVLKLPRRLGVPPGRRADLVSILDVVPTLVANLALPVPPEVAEAFEGIDLLQASRDDAFSQRGRDGHSLLTTDWRFVEQAGEPAMLFDRRSDPHELVDVAAAHPERVATLRARAVEIAGETPTGGPLFEITEDVSKQRRRQLRALGYVVD